MRAVTLGPVPVTAPSLGALVLVPVLLTALAGCAGTAPPAANRPTSETSSTAATAFPTPPPVSPQAPASDPTAPATAAPSPPAPAGPFRLRIPALGIERLRVVAYRGTADDRPGTVIQDRGHAAAPRGPRGGVRPGQVGNLVITAHRTTAGRPFGRLPSLQHGEHVLVEAEGYVYDYRITRTMTISFRSARDRARQSAPVPGRLGVRATRPMITLSTCATPEDRAAGNYWSDELGNPEHRIDKVGVLVDVRRA